MWGSLLVFMLWQSLKANMEAIQWALLILALVDFSIQLEGLLDGNQENKHRKMFAWKDLPS